ncbi:MAG: nuclear transport factor 2 family protein [Nocardiopsaceae bacterium]|nr:nuclear transport factor 2 family protein [Nocardiopsaceae bacterium]
MPTEKTVLTPAELFREGITRLWRDDLAGWTELLDEDVVFEFPFAPPGRPRSLEGRSAVAEYMSHLPGALQVDEEPALRVHETTDPGTAILEMSVRARVKATGAPFEQQYVVVLEAANGLITSYRDYWNPLVAMEMETGA